MDVKAMLLQRDRQSFDWLYSQYAAILFGLIRRTVTESSTAESLLQETFVTAWRSLDQFEGPGKEFFNWLLRIAKHKINEHISDSNGAAQPPIEQNKELWMSTFYSQTVRERQYSNL
jgi:RNA polymerase sigma-70 factor (ECF subfamily)